jgi:hypothetical protein
MGKDIQSEAEKAIVFKPRTGSGQDFCALAGGPLQPSP